MESLFLLQKKFIRVICGMGYYDSTSTAFSRLNVLQLNDIHVYFTSIYFFKILNSDEAHFFMEKISYFQIDHEHNTRSNSFRLPKVKVYKFKQCAVYQFLSIWKKLPVFIKFLRSKRSFKNLLKMYLIDMY